MERRADDSPVNTLSPGDIEVTWARLLSIMDEAAATMIRTAYSITIRESKDLAVVLFDRQGRALAESAIASPSFLGTLPRTLEAFVSTYPISEWQSDDLVITNDPWIGSGHLQDITMASPIYLADHLLGFVAISAHGPDIGGSLYSAMSREIFEEGLRIPICRYAQNGQRNQLVKNFIESNVRVPEKVIGDLEGMAACCRTAGEQVSSLVKELGSDRYQQISEQVIQRSARAIKESIVETTDGTFSSVVSANGINSPFEICCRIVIEGSSVNVDYEGTSASQTLGINVPYCYTYAHTIYPLKCIFGPTIPNNHGTINSFSVKAPQGSILNPLFPAPVNARHLTGQFLSAAVLLALSEALPDKVIAESGVPRPQVVFSGENDRGTRFVEHIFLSSGVGAGDQQDGPHSLCYPTNTSNTPVEILESLTPLLVISKAIRPNSGGSGAYRGGCGQHFEVRNIGRKPIRVSMLADLTHRGSQGLFGGNSGAPAEFMLDGKTIGDKSVFDLLPDSILDIKSAGGGGFGQLNQRTKDRINADSRGGYVS